MRYLLSRRDLYVPSPTVLSRGYGKVGPKNLPPVFRCLSTRLIINTFTLSTFKSPDGGYLERQAGVCTFRSRTTFRLKRIRWRLIFSSPERCTIIFLLSCLSVHANFGIDRANKNRLVLAWKGLISSAHYCGERETIILYDTRFVFSDLIIFSRLFTTL